MYSVSIYSIKNCNTFAKISIISETSKFFRIYFTFLLGVDFTVKK